MSRIRRLKLTAPGAKSSSPMMPVSRLVIAGLTADLTDFRGGAFLVGTEAFGQQPRKTRQVDEVEGFVLAREHRDRRTLERPHVLPSLLERHRIVLRNRRKSQLDEEPETANQLVLVRNQGGPFVVVHNDPTRVKMSPKIQRAASIAHVWRMCSRKSGPLSKGESGKSRLS